MKKKIKNRIKTLKEDLEKLKLGFNEWNPRKHHKRINANLVLSSKKIDWYEKRYKEFKGISNYINHLLELDYKSTIQEAITNPLIDLKKSQIEANKKALRGLNEKDNIQYFRNNYKRTLRGLNEKEHTL